MSPRFSVYSVQTADHLPAVLAASRPACPDPLPVALWLAGVPGPTDKAGTWDPLAASGEFTGLALAWGQPPQGAAFVPREVVQATGPAWEPWLAEGPLLLLSVKSQAFFLEQVWQRPGPPWPCWRYSHCLWSLSELVWGMDPARSVQQVMQSASGLDPVTQWGQVAAGPHAIPLAYAVGLLAAWQTRLAQAQELVEARPAMRSAYLRAQRMNACLLFLEKQGVPVDPVHWLQTVEQYNGLAQHAAAALVADPAVARLRETGGASLAWQADDYDPIDDIDDIDDIHKRAGLRPHGTLLDDTWTDEQVRAIWYGEMGYRLSPTQWTADKKAAVSHEAMHQALVQAADRAAPQAPVFLANWQQYHKSRQVLDRFLLPLTAYLPVHPAQSEAQPVPLQVQYNMATATGRAATHRYPLGTLPQQGDVRSVIVSYRLAQGGVVLAQDFAQMDVRVIAALSGDRHLQAILSDPTQDLYEYVYQQVHPSTASCSPAQRKQAKEILLACFYGRSYGALAQALSPPQAQRWHQAIPQLFPQAWAFLMNAAQTTKIETITGRLRILAGGTAASHRRQGRNTPVQAAASDLSFESLDALWGHCQRQHLVSQPMAWLYDGLLIDAAPGELALLWPLLQDACTHAVYQACPWLTVPLTSTYSIGRSWGQLCAITACEYQAGPPASLVLQVAGPAQDRQALGYQLRLGYTAHEQDTIPEHSQWVIAGK